MSQAKIAHYQLHSRLGKGAMGVVFRARDERLERDVAIKLLQVNLDHAEAADYAARLLQEARSAARLNHPGIITVYDCGEWRGKSYLAMELVHGITLKDLLDKRGQLSIRQVVSIARQMFAALGHAHRHKVIHRDIKPGNLMLTKEGRLKITDFGIAQLPASDLTRTGTILGSPRYMSPEQLAGKKLDGRADLYSAGVVLYQCLTGKAPFDGETTMNIVYQVLHTTPPAPHELRPDVPRVLSDLVMRCIAKQADARFANLDAALAALLGGESNAPRADFSPEDPTQAFQTEAPTQQASSTSTSPVWPWLNQTGSLLAWLARHGIAASQALLRQLWRMTQWLARQLQRWTPVLWARLIVLGNALRPIVLRVTQRLWSAFRRLPSQGQAGIAVAACALLVWGLWPRSQVAEIEFSQAQTPTAQASDEQADGATLEAANQQRQQLLEQLAQQQGADSKQNEQQAHLSQVKMQPQPDESESERGAEGEKVAASNGIGHQIKQAGHDISRDAKGLFNCVLGQGSCPKAQTQTNPHSERRP